MAGLNQAVVVLILRVGLIALLYLFLMMVILAVHREMARAAAPGSRASTTHPGSSGTASLSGNSAPVSLVVVAAGATSLTPGHRFALRNPTLIGRGSTNDIDLQDEFASNRHVRLLQLDGTWHVEDLGATNGTRLRGNRLRGTAPIAAGDVIGVGRVELRFEEGS